MKRVRSAILATVLAVTALGGGMAGCATPQGCGAYPMAMGAQCCQLGQAAMGVGMYVLNTVIGFALRYWPLLLTALEVDEPGEHVAVPGAAELVHAVEHGHVQQPEPADEALLRTARESDLTGARATAVLIPLGADPAEVDALVADLRARGLQVRLQLADIEHLTDDPAAADALRERLTGSLHLPLGLPLRPADPADRPQVPTADDLLR